MRKTRKIARGRGPGAKRVLQKGRSDEMNGLHGRAPALAIPTVNITAHTATTVL